MKALSSNCRRYRGRRRGVTLVEMLITLAVLLLMMTAVVQIFHAATGSLSATQAFQELDNRLRQIDATVRSDLRGVTARMMPPLNPKDNLGYFEYGENSFADLQAEDCDDYIRFTAKAPPGHPFVGRFWPQLSPSSLPSNGNSSVLPITITSDYAEIIYFLRNGNLYRRVLLVIPERQKAAVQMHANQDISGNSFSPSAFGGALSTSWQGVNDISAHPAPSGPNSNLTNSIRTQIIFNSLGDLTNRENRFAAPRFANDYWNMVTNAVGPDGVPDDLNLDGIPDFYPTLYVDAAGALPAGLIYAPGYSLPTGANFHTMAFPFIYPGAYTLPEHNPTVAGGQVGWIHTPTPDYGQYPYDGSLPNSLLYLQRLNHAPLDQGDSLFTPAAQPPVNTAGNLLQTWWGFPTWRETLSAAWIDPTLQPNLNLSAGAYYQPPGLNRRDPRVVTADNAELLPSMSDTSVRQTPQLFSDGWGSLSNIVSAGNNTNLWLSSWEDDLIMTGVRSFDIKGYDDAYGGYVDLGWADDLRMYQPYSSLMGSVMPTSAPGLSSTPSTLVWPPVDPSLNPSGLVFSTLNQTLAHEGRMPPLTNDQRADAQFGALYYPNYPSYTGNVGDDRNSVVRLRRVWDTWSTDYTTAPAYAINSGGANEPTGPPFSPPAYPSYPPPYPAPLKGIQIQIRVVDPSSQRIKQLTIRHDFTDKL